jgi:ABC-2 type transport system ATP-binding protein
MVAVGTPDDLKARAATVEVPEPTMEEAFIALVQGAA